MLKTIFTIFVIYLGYQVIRGLFTAKKVINNFNQAANQHQQRDTQQQSHNNQPESNYKKATDNIGDYVDYEEVDDK